MRGICDGEGIALPITLTKLLATAVPVRVAGRVLVIVALAVVVGVRAGEAVAAWVTMPA
jgi:hypothetical protein